MAALGGCQLSACGSRPSGPATPLVAPTFGAAEVAELLAATSADRLEEAACAHTPLDPERFVIEDDPALRSALEAVYAELTPRLVVCGELTPAAEAVHATLAAAPMHALDGERYRIAELEELADLLWTEAAAAEALAALALAPDEETLVTAWIADEALHGRTPATPSDVADALIDPDRSPLPAYAQRWSQAVEARRAAEGEGALMEAFLASGVLRYAVDQGALSPYNHRQREILWGAEEADNYIISNGERPDRVRDFVVVDGQEVALDEVEPSDLLGPASTELFEGIAGDDPQAILDGLAPAAPAYAELLEVYAEYLEIVRSGGWEPVEEGRLRVGQDNDAVPALARRLAREGAYDGDLTAVEYTDALRDALERWQTQHQLEPTGRLNRDTRRALDVPAIDRLAEVALSLDAWRQSRLGADVGGTYVWVNVNGFYGELWHEGERVHDWRVVVGRTDWRQADNRATPDASRTPLFSDVMETVIINPYWYLPRSIIDNEIMPHFLAEGYPYLERHGYEVIRETPELYLRQRPGSGNALGRVKFLFYNRFNVYMHDTPSRSLFNESVRAFSHGCVRVHEPRDLAAHILSIDRGWSYDEAARYVRRSVYTEVEEILELETPIPVHLEYVLVSVGDDGARFHGDVYEYEEGAVHRRSLALQAQLAAE